MIKKTISFTFKDARTYIQGPDMLNKTLEVLHNEHKDEPITSLRFAIHRMTGQYLDLTIQENPENNEPHDCIATLSYQTSKSRYLARLTENPAVPTERVPYDEQSLISLCTINKEDKKISLLSPSPFSFVETVVSMNKALHLATIPEATGKWVFCRWESSESTNVLKPNSIEIKLKQTLGTRLTCSEVFCQNELLGKVYFSSKVL